MKIPVLYRLVIIAALAALLVGVAAHYNMVPGAIRQESVVPKAVQLPAQAPDAPTTAPTAPAPLPSTRPSPPKTPYVRYSIWAWNAHMAFLFANGGPITTVGSLMEKLGVWLQIVRQNDTNVSQSQQVIFATALAAGNANPTEGVHFVTIMGDQGGGYLAGINKDLEKLGHDYRAEIIASLGWSRGEDAWWGPQEWKDNPEAMKGGATVGVLREGDWNIVLYKLNNSKDSQGNGIKNNPDPTTWDPDAMNWFAVDDYMKAPELVITGACEDRPVVRQGKLTNEPKHHTCPEAFTSWTPADKNFAVARGGLVKLWSTKENINQMPCVIVGIHKWNVTHTKQVEAMLDASFKAADQVRSYDAALQRAGQASYAVYAEQSPAYWIRYFKGSLERDKMQQLVDLGGSAVMNLADNLLFFGLSEGSGGVGSSAFKATYEGFAEVVKQQYPRILPSYPKTEDAVNLTFLRDLMNAAGGTEQIAEAPKFDEPGPIAKENVRSERNWLVQFDTGKATFTPQAEAELTRLYQQLIVGGALSVEIDGHTDNVGNPESNKSLSEARAFAVKNWLEVKAPTLFPQNRVSVRSFGDTAPIAPNTTPEGRAKNRRVTIVLGSK